MSTTTVTSSEQPVGQTTMEAELTTASMSEPASNREAGQMAVTEEEIPRQVAPEQTPAGALPERQVPETSQGMSEQATATTSSTQGGLPDAAARGKAAVTTTTEPGQGQERSSAEQATESDDDVVEEIQGHPQDGH
jgi:hypothetical protein